VWPELVVRNVHVFNAVLCAFTGFLWARTPGSPQQALLGADPAPSPLSDAVAELGTMWLDDGWIYVPPVRT
jgi:hypothetical protein